MTNQQNQPANKENPANLKDPKNPNPAEANQEASKAERGNEPRSDEKV